MWSCSSCAKLDQKYNVLPVFFIGIKKLCTALADNSWSESRRKFDKLRLDALSIPNYVIKKGRSHGARHGKTEEQKEYHIAWNAWKRCCNKVDSQGGHSTNIHDRESQLAIGWTDQKCREWDELAQEYHTYHLTPEEQRRYQGQWYLTLNKSGKNGPMKLRSDFRAAVSIKNRLHHESGEKVEEPISPQQYKKWHPSSSTSWWDKSEWNWKWAHLNFSSDLPFVTVGFVYSRWRSTVTDGVCRQIHLTRHFLMHFYTQSDVHTHCMAQDEPPNVSV